MAVKASDLPDILEERDHSQRALDRWGAVFTTYSQWHSDNSTAYERYAGSWPTFLPDGKSIMDDPIVPDFIRLAAEARSRGVAASVPAIVCRREKLGDAAKAAADKRERVIGSFWDHSRIMDSLVPRWAFDAMMTGVMACEIWPEFDKPKLERFPTYKRIEPNHLFPDPIFTPGPWLDSCIVAYSQASRTIATEYGVTVDTVKNSDRALVIKYYDPERVIVIVEYFNRMRIKAHTTLVDVPHTCGRTPIVIGTRPTADGIYRGEFDNARGILEHWNRLETLSLDEPIQAVYPEKIAFDGEDDEESGPGAVHRLETAQSRYEYLQRPNQPFTNMQKSRDYAGFVRAATIFPPSLSGDPNESVISAAGINASGAQHLQDIASIQTDILAPMLQAANELALKQDVEYSGDVTKTIYGGSSKHRETYNPVKDIGDDYRNEVVYGALSGLDPINRGVMALQQWQGGLWSKRMAMEMDPNIQDASRVMKEQVVEKLTEAGIAGLQQAASKGELRADVWAKIMRAIKEDDYSLEQAIEEFMVTAPLAEPPGQPGQPAATPGAPGIPGAAEGGPQAPRLPPLPQLFAGA